MSNYCSEKGFDQWSPSVPLRCYRKLSTVGKCNELCLDSSHIKCRRLLPVYIEM